VSPETLAEWRENAERMQTLNWQGEPVADLRIISLIDALQDMTREAQLSREATEKTVRSRFARHEIERALRAADVPEDSMATDDDLLRYEGRAEAVEIVRDMLELDDA
jgi:hypothetical protein